MCLRGLCLKLFFLEKELFKRIGELKCNLGLNLFLVFEMIGMVYWYDIFKM